MHHFVVKYKTKLIKRYFKGLEKENQKEMCNNNYLGKRLDTFSIIPKNTEDRQTVNKSMHGSIQTGNIHNDLHQHFDHSEPLSLDTCKMIAINREAVNIRITGSNHNDNLLQNLDHCHPLRSSPLDHTEEVRKGDNYRIGNEKGERRDFITTNEIQSESELNKSLKRKTGFSRDHVHVFRMEKRHMCQVCEKSFSRKDGLTRHMLTHTKIKQYRCDQCGHLFSRLDNLKCHLRVHAKDKKFICPYCSYRTCRKDMVVKHMCRRLKN